MRNPGPRRPCPRPESSPTPLRKPRILLQNRDLDTGNPVRPAGYRLTDDTYADLLHRLAATPRRPIPPGVKEDILAYYKDPDLPFATKEDPGAWSVVLTDLGTLKGMPTSTEPEPFPTYGEQAATGDSSTQPAKHPGE